MTRGQPGPPAAACRSRQNVVADRETPGVFYANDGAKMYFSADGGTTFTQREDVTLPIGSGRLCATPGKAGHLWLITSKIGLHRSVDGGVRFERVATVKDAQAIGFGAAAAGKDYPTLYLVGAIGNVSGIFRSDDTGATWVKINDDAHEYGPLSRAIAGDPAHLRPGLSRNRRPRHPRRRTRGQMTPSLTTGRVSDCRARRRLGSRGDSRRNPEGSTGGFTGRE